MKNYFAILSAIMLVAYTEKKTRSTYVYSWADYIPQFVYEDFEKETVRARRYLFFY